MKTDLFQSHGHCWVFQICCHIECSTCTAPSFRIWNSSTGIPSPPLALFVVMLSKAHLTSHSRMSGSRWVWVIIPSWLSRSWRSFFVQFFCVFLPPLLKSSASVRSIPFLSFIEAIFAWNVPLLLLLLSCFSCVRSVRPHRLQPTRFPCPWDSPGNNTGVGCHFLLQCMKVKSEREVAQRPHGLQPTRLLRPWDFPGKSTGVGCHCLLRYCHLVVHKNLLLSFAFLHCLLQSHLFHF